MDEEGLIPRWVPPNKMFNKVPIPEREFKADKELVTKHMGGLKEQDK